jgi:hypothetical protein
LFKHRTESAFLLAAPNAGNSKPAKTAMIAMTTSSSIKVKADLEFAISDLRFAVCDSRSFITSARSPESAPSALHHGQLYRRMQSI